MNDALLLVQRFYSLLAAGDVDGALALLAASIEWTEAERTPYFAGTMRGVNAVVLGLFVPLERDFYNFSTIPLEFVSEGDRVISLGKYAGTAKITGRTLSVPFVHDWTVSNGRLHRFVQYTDSTAWHDALSAPPDDRL